MNRLIANAMLSVGLIAGAASLAVAQTTTATPGPQVRPGMEHHQHHGMRAPGERVEARLAYIKTALKITDAQLPQWNAFADFQRKQATQRDQQMQQFHTQMSERKNAQRPNAIERLERQQQFMATAATRTNELLAVSKPLYTALSPEQKAVADRLLASRERGMEHGRRGMHRRA